MAREVSMLRASRPSRREHLSSCGKEAYACSGSVRAPASPLRLRPGRCPSGRICGSTPSGPGPAARRGFTLVELIVVIMILALLAVIVAPAATSLLDRSKVTSTHATLEILEQAINEYRKLGDPTGNLNGKNDLCGNPSLSSEYVKLLFGPFPPSPTTTFSRESSVPAQWAATDENDPNTSMKFDRLVEAVILGETSTPWARPAHPSPDYASIECLVLFLRKFSPEARRILDKLPDSAKSTKDRDPAYDPKLQPPGLDPGDAVPTARDLKGEVTTDPVELKEPVYGTMMLIEIVDAWGRPLRYAVRPPGIDPSTMERLPEARVEWEVRSAGPDGAFAPPFTAEDRSDDVIIRGRE